VNTTDWGGGGFAASEGMPAPDRGSGPTAQSVRNRTRRFGVAERRQPIAEASSTRSSPRLQATGRHTMAQASPMSPSPRLLAAQSTAIAAEHVARVLHMIDADLDELFTLDQLCAFAQRCSLPFSRDLLESMFAEANVTHDGQMNEDQLGKAVGGRFPYRRHNDDWIRLLEMAPRDPSTRRITTLPTSQSEREEIKASFQKEREILTFTPNMWASPSRSAPRAASRSRMRTPDDSPAVLHGFEQLAAFDAALVALERASEADGWRDRLLSRLEQPTPPQIFFEIHDQPWMPSNQRNVIPVRVDGEMTRTGPHDAPMRWQGTENQGPARGNGLANSRTARLHGVHAGVKPFVAVFDKISIQREKAAIARDSIERASKRVEPLTRDVASGYPGGYCFRMDRPPKDKPLFKTRLGAVWPKNEGRPPSDLAEPGYFPTRLAFTENFYPGGPPHPHHTAPSNFM